MPRQVADAEALLASIKADIDRLVDDGRKAEAHSEGSLILRQHRQRAMAPAKPPGGAGRSRSWRLRGTGLVGALVLIGAGLAFGAVHGLGQTDDVTVAAGPAVEVQAQNSVDASAAVVQSEAPPAEPDVPAAFTLSVPGRAAVIATVPTSAITTASISPVLAVDAAPTSTASVEAEAPHRRPSVAQRVITRRAGGGNGAAAASATSAHDRKWTATFYER